MIRFTCNECGKRLRAPESAIGKKTKCPKCGTRVVVPMEPLRPPAPLLNDRRFSDDDESEPPMHFPHPVEEEEGIDMTAMVDVTFFLLIFFLVTSMSAIQASLAMPTPEAKTGAVASPKLSELESDDDFITVRIDADDTIWVEETETTRMELVPKLRRLREKSVKGKTPNSMLVVTHGDAHHETVVAVLDSGSEVGMENVRLSSQDDDEL